MCEVLKLSCWVSCLVSRELNYFQSGSWNTGTVVLSRIHKGCIYTMPLSTTQSDSTRQKFLKNYCSLVYSKKILAELILSADILAKGPPSLFYRAWRQRTEWTLRNACLLYRTSVECSEEEGSFSIHSITLFIPPPQARPLESLLKGKRWQNKDAKKNKRIPHFQVPRRCPIIYVFSETTELAWAHHAHWLENSTPHLK